MYFGLCPKRDRDAWVVLFQQWGEEDNSGPVAHFLPTTILQEPWGQKKANMNKRLNALTCEKFHTVYVLGLHFV